MNGLKLSKVGLSFFKILRLIRCLLIWILWWFYVFAS